MRIYVLRHGQAEPQQTTDEARELTQTGRDDTHRVLTAASPRMDGVEHIASSPLVRARQTAAIAKTLFPSPSLEIQPLLIPEADLVAVYDWLGRFDAGSRILLVSHQPLVGQLVNQLCGSAPGTHPMDTSSLAAIDCEIPAPGLGTLAWIYHR